MLPPVFPASFSSRNDVIPFRASAGMDFEVGDKQQNNGVNWSQSAKLLIFKNYQ